MGWKATGQPTVRKQRDRWAVRVDGIDTATGKHRPRQLGTYASRRSAMAAARETKADAASAGRGTVSWLVRRYVAGRTDITQKARESYEWAIPHIEGGLGAIPLARLDREDVAAWIDALATGGKLSKRSIRISSRSTPGARLRCGGSSRPAAITGGRSRSASTCYTGCGEVRSSPCIGTTSTLMPRRCASTRASSPSAPASPGATPRTSDPADASPSTTTRSVC